MNFKGFDDYIEIFRGGRQTDSRGRMQDGDKLIASAVKSFNAQDFEPPLVAGHPADNAPAYGWVEALKAEERAGVQVLLAKFKQVNPEFAELVKTGAFKKRSASFYPDGSLRHVGFLGATPPAVIGLKDIAFKSAGDDFEFNFNENSGLPENQSREETRRGGSNMTLKHFMEGFLFWRKANPDAPLDADLNFTFPAAGDKPTPPASFSEADLTKVKDEAAKAEREKVLAEFAEKEKTAAKTARQTEIKNFCDKLVAEGKLPPAMAQADLVLFMEALPADAAINFSQSQAQSPYDFFRGYLERLTAMPLFKEIASKNAASADFTEAKKQEDVGLSIAAKVNPKESK